MGGGTIGRGLLLGLTTDSLVIILPTGAATLLTFEIILLAVLPTILLGISPDLGFTLFDGICPDRADEATEAIESSDFDVLEESRRLLDNLLGTRLLAIFSYLLLDRKIIFL